MAGDPTLVVKLGKEDAEFLLAQLDGMIRALAEDLAEDANINEELAREAIDRLLDIVGFIEEAATGVGLALERVEVGPDREDDDDR